MLYHIIKVNKYRKGGALIIHEKTVTTTATWEDVQELVRRQGEDIDQVQIELEDLGITNLRGDMIAER